MGDGAYLGVDRRKNDRRAVAWFSGLPESIKAVASAMGVLMSIAMTAFAIGMARNPDAETPGKLRALAKADSILAAADSSIAARVVDLEADAPRSEYLFCVDLADRHLISKTPMDCYQDFMRIGQP